MKIVINRCFGGFGLSDEAFQEYLNRKGIEWEAHKSRETFGYDHIEYYQKGHAGNVDYYISPYEVINNRADKDLVDIVEQLGEKANGWAAKLKVIEIPDNVKWHIHEYDGSEYVAEDHRTWL